MTVWLVHPVTADLSAAHQFGRIETVNDRYIYADDVEQGQVPYGFHQHVVRAALEFKVDDDFLLMVGDHLQWMVMSAELAVRHRRFRVLRWDRFTAGYLPVWIDTTGDNYGRDRTD